VVWVGGARPPPFTTFTITYKVSVYAEYAPAELTDMKLYVHELGFCTGVETVLRQNVASHNVYVTKRNCY
jgi:hypothetical protein